MLPFLFLIVGYRRNIKPVLIHIKKSSVPWIVWSTVGFGLVYTPLTFGTVYSSSLL
ncbi:multidrug resistance efflux transporter family protein [Pseudogracilibacillus sp. SO30301A]|uniref:multidrug resistance efflux transporter family protein n=1 Tax=Pseudogracilibacillus sp. SO30301A TaxID=3098291 RepID=UPI00300E2411